MEDRGASLQEAANHFALPQSTVVRGRDHPSSLHHQNRLCQVPPEN